ncbi:MAG: adenylate cyclase [Alteromonadaceae bacterium]|nr:adenylate cyclase [Alteromonadaceae bacterium]
MIKMQIPIEKTDTVFSIRRLGNIQLRPLCEQIALLCILVLCIQIPNLLQIKHAAAYQQIAIIVLHVALLAAVPILSRWQRHDPASLILISGYCSYLIFSCMNFEFRSNTHYFFLLGLFVLPALYFNKRSANVALTMSIFLLLFMFFETHEKRSATVDNVSPLTAAINQSNLISFALSSFLIAFYIYLNFKKHWQQLKAERNRSDALLLNILPPCIAVKLKDHNGIIADRINNASVLFADLQHFTQLTNTMQAEQLVKILNELFSEFDNIAEQYDLEKIKTIGDQYMAVGGAPLSRTNQVINVCNAAIDMRRQCQRWRRKHNLNTGIRVGICTGDIIAGVIGQHKFTYDLWGDTVNLASRLESHSKPNSIHVCAKTAQLTKQHFEFSKMENTLLKGLPLQTTYYLEANDVKA